MKIAILSPPYVSVPPASYGGTERVVAWLNDEFIKTGHDVTLFATGDSRTSGKLIPICDRATGIGRSRKSELAHLVEIEQIWSMSHEFDIIHSHMEHWFFPHCRRLRTPVISTCHRALDQADLAQFYESFPDVPLVSISLAQRLPVPQANWVENIYHGLPTNLYKPSYGEGKYLAFLGRLAPTKGVVEAIKIAIGSGYPLMIAGNVQDVDRNYFESEVKPLLGGSIEYIGPVNDREKNELLGNASALLFPILCTEAFGLVMIEALACATPVIGFNRDAVPEVIEDGVTGFTVTSVDEAIVAVDYLSGIQRSNCRLSFENRFSVETMAARYTWLFENWIRFRDRSERTLETRLSRAL